MMNNLVSIIIPVYNSEPYLERCLSSVLSQTYVNIEVLLIDDGSTDNSYSICRKFEKQDKRIRLYHQENMGAAAARNTGLEKARGDYIMFCDSDDMVSRRWVEHLVKYIIDNDKLIMSFSFIGYDLNQLGEESDTEVASNIFIPKCEIFRWGIIKFVGYNVNTVFIKSIIDRYNLRFRSQKDKADYNEDLLFVTSYLEHVDGFVYSGYMDYCYMKREGSLSRADTPYYFEKYEEKYKISQELISRYGNELDRKESATFYLYHFLVSYKDAVKKNNYARFREIVKSDVLHNCLKYADTSKEDPREISLLKANKTIFLWYYNKLLNNRRKYCT